MAGLNIAWFVLILIGLVVVHEAGHMVVAKLCGMRVERFSLFMGKPIWSFRRGETEYGVGWLPLGGYVKITGMTRDEEIPPEAAPRAYFNATTPRKVATILAGPAVNIALAFLLFAAVFWTGAPTLGQPDGTVASIERGSPAASIGLQPGDRIMAVNGVSSAGDRGAEAVRDELRANPERPVRVTIESDGARRVATVSPQAVRDGDQTVGQLGFSFEVPVVSVRYGPWEGISNAGEQTWWVIERTGETVGRLFVSEQARSEINTVVGAGAVFDDVADRGFATVIYFAALLSLAIGIFNLLPFLPLDGGHILFALIERIRGVPMGRVAYERASFVGMALLLLVFVIALQNDISLISDGPLER